MMTGQHYDDATLIELLASNGATADRHLATCRSCAEAFESYRDLTDILRDKASWHEEPVPNDQSDATLRALRVAADRMETEDAAGEALVESLLEQPSEKWSRRALEDPAFRTAGAVRKLIAAAEARIDLNAAEALEICRIAVVTAEALDSSRYGIDTAARLRGLAGLQLAYTLFYGGEFTRAMVQVDRAEIALKECSIAEFELARLGVVRGLVLAGLGRYEQAVASAHSSAAVFRSYGQRAKLASALGTAAYIHIEAKRYREAAEVLSEIEENLQDSIDPDTRARTLANLGICCANTGRIADAVQYYQLAAALHEANGTTTESLRVRYYIANLLAREGRFAEAEPRLRSVSADFERLGMHWGVIWANLALCEILLLQGQPAEVETLCRNAVRQLETGGLLQSSAAMTALSQLHEAAAQRRATPEAVRRVLAITERHRDDRPVLHAPIFE